jgi:hypothetical protein
MTVLFVASFILGLVFGVVAMFRGVERVSRTPARPAPGISISHDPRQISARLNLPVVASFATLFGATGYLLVRYTTLGPIAGALLAALAGGAGVVSAVLLVAKWAVPAARQEIVDERYLLQGHVARVSRPIGPDGAGEIVFEADGVRHTARAVAVDGSRLEPEADVVIERIEGGVAYVEPWSLVERRL